MQILDELRSLRPQLLSLAEEQAPGQRRARAPVCKQDAEKIKRRSNFSTITSASPIRKKKKVMNKICFEIKSKQLYNITTKYPKEGS